MAIVDRENDSLVPRLGPIPLSKHAICAINELNQMTLDDQARLVDVLEEGRFNKGAYGLWFEIESPTTIIASANPINATWEDASAISNDEVSILKNLLDRFDQIFGFRDNFTEKEAQSFAEKMSMLRKKDKSHNHNFLRKYLVYASGLAVKVTPEADYMLNKFWVKGKVSVTMKNRMYAAIFRIAEAQARLHLRKEVDDDIANQSMESIQYMIKQYGKVVQTITSPSDALYNTFLQILENSKDGTTIYEMCKRASEENEHIAAYLDKRWSLENNHKLRPIIEAAFES